MLHPNQITSLYDSLGIRIKEAREHANYKQTHFAALLRISRASLVNIEHGRQRAPLHILYEVARLLDISLSELLPDINEILQTAVPKQIEDKIKKKSEGDIEIHSKLLDFVSQHTKPSKK